MCNNICYFVGTVPEKPAGNTVQTRGATFHAVGCSVFNGRPQFFRSSLAELTEFLATGLLNEKINFASKDVSFIVVSGSGLWTYLLFTI